MTKQQFNGDPKEIVWDKLESPSGKGSIVYNAHPYHTKLSLSICKTIITQLSKVGETVLDPFCGSGIVGVAAILESRNAIVKDLSPYATHIARGLTTKARTKDVEVQTQKVVSSVRQKVGYLFTTSTRDTSENVETSYLVWSDYMHCPSCNAQFLLWNAAIQKDGVIKKKFNCPECGELIQKNKLKRTSGLPVEIVYWNKGKSQHREIPNAEDLQKATEPHVNLNLPWLPNEAMLHIEPGVRWGEQWRKGYHKEITHVSNFFSERNWMVLGFLWEEIQKVRDENIRNLLRLGFTGTLVNVSKMVRYIPSRGGRSNTPGTLYCPSVWLEQNPLLVYERRMKRICKLVKLILKSSNDVRVLTGSASNLWNVTNKSVDLIVTDPPFGANIQYAELNFIPEAWLQEFTDVKNEAVENPFRKQGRPHYLSLLDKSLQEMYRVLKPGRYVAFFFNTTDASLWKDLKQLFKTKGFAIVKSVPALKGHAGWNQVRHQETVAGWDPVIFLWKPYGQTSLFHHSQAGAIWSTREFIIHEVEKSDGDVTYPYQLWYSKYVSEWFIDKIDDDLLGIKEFVKAIKEQKDSK